MNDANPIPSLDDDYSLQDEVIKLERQLQEIRSVAVPLAEQLSSKTWQLDKTDYELKLYKRRKVIQLLEALRVLVKNPLSPSKFGRKLQVAFRPAEPLTPPQRKESPDNLLTELIKTKRIDAAESPYLYPNLRVATVADTPSFTTLAPPLRLGDDWRESLRPDIDSVDLVLFEIQKPSADTKFPYRLAKEVAKVAQKAQVPIVVAIDSGEAREDLLSIANVVIPISGNLEVATKGLDDNKMHKLRPSVDVRTYNPTNWKLKPKGDLVVVGEQPPNSEDLKIYTDSIKSHFPLPHIFGPDRLAQKFNSKIHHGNDMVECYSMSKSYKLTYCTPSMFSSPASYKSAILRLLASGSHVATTDDLIVKEINVPALHLVKDAEQAFLTAKIVNDVDQRERLSVLSRRHIMQHYSPKACFDDLLQKIDIKTDINETVSIILPTNRPDYIERAIENTKRQIYVSVELVLVLHGESFNVADVRKKLDGSRLNYRIVECPSSMVFGECLNRGFDASTGYYVTKFDDDDHYGPEHLNDLVVAHRYSGAHVVGKWAHYVHLQESNTMLNYRLPKQERFTGHLPGGTFLITRALLSRFRFGKVRNAIDTELWYRIQEQGGRMYSTHRFNYVRVRHDDNTWVQNDEFFVEQSEGSAAKGSGPEIGFL